MYNDDQLGMNRAVKFICVLLMLSVSPCRAADLAADQVRAMLDAAGPDHPADLSGKSLEDLDLSNLDFKRTNLSRANLFGAKLVGADFSGVLPFDAGPNPSRHLESQNHPDENLLFDSTPRILL